MGRSPAGTTATEVGDVASSELSDSSDVLCPAATPFFLLASTCMSLSLSSLSTWISTCEFDIPFRRRNSATSCGGVDLGLGGGASGEYKLSRGETVIMGETSLVRQLVPEWRRRREEVRTGAAGPRDMVDMS